jgi:dihydroflavonol-4-reductase
MRIFVLGATGHVGNAVVRHSLACGHAVTAAIRQANPVALRGLGVARVHVDEGFARLTEVAAGHDVMVDAAAPYPLEMAVPGSGLWRIVIDRAVRRTRRVVDAALHNGLRLAFLSSCTTLPREEPPLRAIEAAWRRSVYPYFEAKAAMERTVMAAAGEGLQAVIVNPASCLGPWEFRERMSFTRAVLSGQFSLIMDHTVNVIDVRDLAIGIELALSRECFGRPIPMAGHNVTLQTLAARITALAGGRAVPISVDARLSSMVAFWAGATSAAFGLVAPEVWRAVPLTADILPMRPSPEQISIGLTIRPLEETLRDSVAFHRGFPME